MCSLGILYVCKNLMAPQIRVQIMDTIRFQSDVGNALESNIRQIWLFRLRPVEDELRGKTYRY